MSDAERIALFREQNGHDPVRSSNCSGCPSWPFAMCLRCAEANRELYVPPPTRAEVERLRGERDLACAKLRAVESMVVARVGGIVEGAPTSRVNYLQRIDALAAAESDAARLRAALEAAVERFSSISCLGAEGPEAFALEGRPLSGLVASMLKEAMEGWRAARAVLGGGEP